MTAGASRDDYEDSSRVAWASGLSTFGGVLLATVGLFQFLAGLTAVFNDKVYVTTVNYLYQFDISAWGWIHILIGLLAIGTGIAILYGQTWSLVVGIVLAVASAATNFMFIPYYPFWSLIVIVIDIAVIWALSVLIRR